MPTGGPFQWHVQGSWCPLDLVTSGTRECESLLPWLCLQHASVTRYGLEAEQGRQVSAGTFKHWCCIPVLLYITFRMRDGDGEVTLPRGGGSSVTYSLH